MIERDEVFEIRAVKTLEVTPIGDGNSHVFDLSAVSILQVLAPPSK